MGDLHSCVILQLFCYKLVFRDSQSKKCPYSELFWYAVRIFRFSTKIRQICLLNSFLTITSRNQERLITLSAAALLRFPFSYLALVLHLLNRRGKEWIAAEVGEVTAATETNTNDNWLI